jgi:hypothetical protein
LRDQDAAERALIKHIENARSRAVNN